MRSGTWLARYVLAGAVGLSALTGCGDPDPRFVQASQKREARIAGHLQRWSEREAEGPGRLKVMEGRIARSVAKDPQQLQTTWSYIEESHDRTVELWPARRARTQAVVREQLRGDVEDIDQTIPRMFY